VSDDGAAWLGDAFAEYDTADQTPWVYMAVVMPMDGLEALLKALAGLGFVDSDWCELRRRSDQAMADYGPCPPPWKRKAAGDG